MPSPCVSTPGEARTSPGAPTWGDQCPVQPRQRRGHSVPTGRGHVEAATVPGKARESPMLSNGRGEGEGYGSLNPSCKELCPNGQEEVEP